MKVASFPPEFIELFRQASVKEVRVGPLSESRAHSFRSRLNKLRVAMRKEKHDALNLAEQVTLKIESVGLDTYYLVATPEGDRDLIAALSKAGIEVEFLPEENEVEEAQAVKQQSAEGFFAALQEFKGDKE